MGHKLSLYWIENFEKRGINSRIPTNFYRNLEFLLFSIEILNFYIILSKSWIPTFLPSKSWIPTFFSIEILNYSFFYRNLEFQHYSIETLNSYFFSIEILNSYFFSFSIEILNFYFFLQYFIEILNSYTILLKSWIPILFYWKLSISLLNAFYIHVYLCTVLCEKYKCNIQNRT